MFFYNAPKDDSKFALLACSEWDSANSRIDFSEAVFLFDDDFYYVFAYATGFKDVNKIGDRSWKFTPQLVNFKVSRKNYKSKKYDKDTEKWSEVEKEQSIAEKIVCKILENVSENVFYKGHLDLCSDSTGQLALTGKDYDGGLIPESMIKMMLRARGELIEVPSPAEFTLDDVKLPEKKNGNYARGGGQKELEKLEDRVTFICNQLAKIGIEPISRDVYGIYLSMKGNEDALAVVEIAKDLM